MSGYFSFLNTYGIKIDRMSALDPTRVAENVLLQPEDRISLDSKYSRTPCDLLTVALGEGFHEVDEWIDWVRFLFINLTLGSSLELKIQRIQIRAGRWQGMISSSTDDTVETFKFVVQES